MTDKVIRMESLHDDNHDAVLFVVQSAKRGVRTPVVCGLPQSVRESVGGFQWVVDDQIVPSSTGQCSSYGSCHSKSTLGCHEVVHGQLLSGQSRGKRPL